MNIGDRINVNLMLEVESMERDCLTRETYITGRAKNQHDSYFFVKVPLTACKVVDSRLDNVLKETYLNGK